jgi:hypothetical protein
VIINRIVFACAALAVFSAHAQQDTLAIEPAPTAVALPVAAAGAGPEEARVPKSHIASKTAAAFGMGIAEGLFVASIAAAYGKGEYARTGTGLIGAGAGYVVGSTIGTAIYCRGRNEKGSVLWSLGGACAGALVSGLMAYGAEAWNSDILGAASVCTFAISVPIGSAIGFERGR